MFWDLRISYFFERKVIFLETGNQFLGTERVSKLMRQYAIPCIISLLVGALYNIVDQIFIANASYLGSYGNAANTVVFPLTVVALAIAVMVGDGCCAFVSMALGRNEIDKAVVRSGGDGCSRRLVSAAHENHQARVRRLYPAREHLRADADAGHHQLSLPDQPCGGNGGHQQHAPSIRRAGSSV